MWTGPYVLVAHSWGGLTAKLFASRYPNAVAGLVLVDPGSEFLKTSLTPAQWAKLAGAAKKLGEPRALEAVDYEPSVAALRAAPPARAIPMVVLTADKQFDFRRGRCGDVARLAGSSGSCRNASQRQARHPYEQRPLHPRGAAAAGDQGNPAGRRGRVQKVHGNSGIGAGSRNRTHDQRFTNRSLSYGTFSNQALATHATFQEQLRAASEQPQRSKRSYEMATLAIVQVRAAPML